MKKINYLSLLGFMLTFAACSNEDNLELSHQLPENTGNNTINLETLNYSHLANVLNTIPEEQKPITVTNGENAWDVYIHRNTQATITGKGNTVLFNGRSKDSIDFALSPNYATLRITRNGHAVNYVAYKDKEKMHEIAEYYQNQYLPSRSTLSDGIITCSGNQSIRSNEEVIECVKIDITKAIQCNPRKKVHNNDVHAPKATQSNDNTWNRSTRNWDTTPPTLEFWLLNEEDGNNIEHEVTWQIQSMITSIEFLTGASLAQYYFSIYDMPFKGTEVGFTAEDRFWYFLRTWDFADGQGDKIFFLMRNGTWDNGETLGYCHDIGIIDINKQETNYKMCAVATTSSLYPHTMAHELGHLLGAEHVDDDPTDLMYYTYSDETMPNHINAQNIETMIAHLTPNP